MFPSDDAVNDDSFDPGAPDKRRPRENNQVRVFSFLQATDALVDPHDKGRVDRNRL